MSKRISSILVSKELFNNLKEILIILYDDQTNKRHQCKTLLLFFLLCFIFHKSSIAQVDYWLEFNEGYDIGSITQTTRANQTIEIDIANNSLENFLNNQMVYKIRKAFPTSITPRLQRVYLITLNLGDVSTAVFLNRPEIANFGINDTVITLTQDIGMNIDLPNDYEDVISGGRNTALDLIKAPLAWKYSTGQNILIGISDTFMDENHPDLIGQIEQNLSTSTLMHGTSTAGTIVAKANNDAGSFDLILQKESNENGKSIYEEAEVSITMDDIIFQAWDGNGKKSSNLSDSKIPNKKIVNSNNAILEDIMLDGNSHGTVYISFNFLTDELTNKRKYIYHLIQKDAVTGEVIGGETFEIRKKGLHIFQAQAIGPATAIKNAPISLSATIIDEEATYNWYDSEGNLIHQGENFDITPTKTETYKLEVIATKDGFKDYDQVSISVPPHEIISISPNPSSTTIRVDYFAQGATEGYLSVVNTSTAATHNYVLDLSEETITIDISNLTNGYYEVALVTDNQVQDSETILKN